MPSFGPVVLSMPVYLSFVFEGLFTKKMLCLSVFSGYYRVECKFDETLINVFLKNRILIWPVVQRMDKAIHWINRYLADKSQQNKPRYPLDSDLSVGYRYPAFDQPRPAQHFQHVNRPPSTFRIARQSTHRPAFRILTIRTIHYNTVPFWCSVNVYQLVINPSVNMDEILDRCQDCFVFLLTFLQAYEFVMMLNIEKLKGRFLFKCDCITVDVQISNVDTLVSSIDKPLFNVFFPLLSFQGLHSVCSKALWTISSVR